MSVPIANPKDRSLRRLLPTSARPQQLNLDELPPRSMQAVSACTACRKHKAKCTAERPACRRCAQRRVPCQYTTQPGETRSQALRRNYDHLRDRAVAYEEVVELLKHLSDDEAQIVYQQIRAGIDVSTIVNHITAGDILIQMAVAPETRLRYEFPYRPELFQMQAHDNPYLSSIVYEATSLFPGQPSRTSPGLAVVEDTSQYLKPFHAARVMESRLTDAKSSAWTAVSDNDVLMRELLEVLFGCEFHFTAAFQKDYFLEDMAAMRQDFCSSLLVNAVLAYACVCSPRFVNRAEYWNPHTLMYRFLAEAKRLWELEATEPRITTIQAGIVFNVIHNLCGLDEIGQAYRIQAVALAHQLQLLDSTAAGPQDDRTRRGWAYTAWALWNWETLVGFSFNIPPLLTTPPTWPLPNPLEDPRWYGEILVKYPLNQHLSTSYFGLVFHARSHFRTIMNDFSTTAFGQDSEVTVKKAYELRSQLRGWYDSLPGPLQPKAIALPGHLQLHMYYYHLLLTIFEPLGDTPTSQAMSPKEIVTESKKYMQTLIRLYYLRHGFEAMDLFIVIPLMLTAYDALDTINTDTTPDELEALRSMLLLAAKGLYSQRRNHYLSEALYRVIRGRMRPEEARLLKDTVDLDGEEPEAKRAMVQSVRSQWPVSVVKKKDEVDAHKLKNLVESIAQLNVPDGP